MADLKLALQDLTEALIDPKKLKSPLENLTYALIDLENQAGDNNVRLAHHGRVITALLDALRNRGVLDGDAIERIREGGPPT